MPELTCADPPRGQVPMQAYPYKHQGATTPRRHVVFPRLAWGAVGPLLLGLAPGGAPAASQGGPRLAEDPVHEAVRAAGVGCQLADACPTFVPLAQVARELGTVP